jgi:HAD superfamily hydrolase (TIGR01490 family)
MKKNKIAVFDIDGTIFRSSLLIELIEMMIEEKVFSQRVKTSYAHAYKKWFERKGTYEDYINAVVVAFENNIAGVDYRVFNKIAKQVIDVHQNQVYRYTRDLIKTLKKKNYYLLAISHSPKEIVQEFCKQLGFDKVYGRAYEVGNNNKFTARTLQLELISDKAKILKRVLLKENISLADSVGVGDSEGDISLLKLVDQPICFNPNAKLYAKAKRLGWQVVVERKDVIYKIDQ